MQEEEYRRHDEQRGSQRAHRKHAIENTGNCTESEKDAKHKIEYIGEPLQTANEVEIALGKCQAILRFHPVCPGHKRIPMFSENLDAAKAPTESLFLQTLKGIWHQAAAITVFDIERFVTKLENTQAGFGIFGDAPLVPAADLLQG